MAIIKEGKELPWKKQEEQRINELVGDYEQAIDVQAVYRVLGHSVKDNRKYDWQMFDPRKGHRIKIKLVMR